MSRTSSLLVIVTSFLGLATACRTAAPVAPAAPGESSAAGTPVVLGTAAELGFYATHQQQEVAFDDYDDEGDDFQLPPIELLLMLRADEAPREVLRRTSSSDHCDETLAELVDLEGIEESPLKMWQLVCRAGEDSMRVESLTALVRLGAGEAEVLWEGRGLVTDEMGVCNAGRIYALVASEDRGSVRVEEVRWTERVEQDVGFEVPCEPATLRREVVETFALPRER